jgi:hypothetical protein
MQIMRLMMMTEDGRRSRDALEGTQVAVWRHGCRGVGRREGVDVVRGGGVGPRRSEATGLAVSDEHWHGDTARRVQCGQLQSLVLCLSLHLITTVLEPDFHLHNPYNNKSSQVWFMTLKYCIRNEFRNIVEHYLKNMIYEHM